MKKGLLFTAAVLLAVSTVYGQGTKENKDVNPCKHGLLFDVEGLNHFGLGSYGCGIGMKMIGGNYALRPMISFSTLKTQDDPGIAGYTGGTDSKTKIGFDLDFLRQMNTTMKLQPYCGLGVGWESMKIKTESGHADQVNPATTDSSKTTIGFRGILGAEYFLGKHFSLSCEYRIGYFHSVEKIKFSAPLQLKTANEGLVSAPESKTTVSGFRIYTNPRITLGIYF
jgi:opacity protein-like surface antigen